MGEAERFAQGDPGVRGEPTVNLRLRKSPSSYPVHLLLIRLDVRSSFLSPTHGHHCLCNS